MKTISKAWLWLIIICISKLSASGAKKNALPLPNIVWLVSEDNCPYIGVYGDKIAHTPNIDKLARSGVVYDHAFSSAPVCAPARNTIITGVYANSLGTHQMRSNYKLPEFVKFFPEYLRKAGYYTTNFKKEDYNTRSADSLKHAAWDESYYFDAKQDMKTYRNRKPGQPFFHVQNFGITHESSLFDSIPDDQLKYKPDDMVVFPYHPNTRDFRHDFAQYYHRISQLDKEIGEVVDELKKQGLLENTIIFYYGDNGGVFPRGKRYLFESGTRVPLIVYVPEMYRHLLPEKIGTHSKRIVSFVDLAPTILNVVGVKIPEYMQGQPFLGKNVPTSPDCAFMFRGRMDERYDLMYAARNVNYRYIRNYYPERIYAQHLQYLWKSRAIREWERLYEEGKLNNVQSAYWETKPYEELYDIVKDPHNINNLAKDPEYVDVLNELRRATDNWIGKIEPIDVIPEQMLFRIDKNAILYDSLKRGNFPLMKVHEVARMSARASSEDFKALYAYTKDKNPAIAFWGIKAMFQFGDKLKSSGLLDEFKTNLLHPELFIQLLTANVLIGIGEKQDFKKLILDGVNSDVRYNRMEALELYEQLPRENDIDKRIIERYENELKVGGGDEKNVYDELFKTKL